MTIYLYKKTHNKTGLKYLGMTKQKDPYRYPGSGDYWLKHLAIHGYNFTTEILRECKTKDEVKEWGLYYTNLWNIVNEKDKNGKKTWANLKPENGIGGFGKLSKESKQKGVNTRRRRGSYIQTPEASKKRIESMKKNGTYYNQTPESIQKALDTKRKNNTTNKGKKHTTAQLIKMRDSHLGKSPKLKEEDVRIIKTSILPVKELAKI